MKRYTREETLADNEREDEALVKSPWEPIDVFLALATLLITLILATTIAADYLPHNYNSQIHLYPNFLTDSISNQLIVAAEEYGAEKGWQTGRHRNYPTTDFPLRDLEFPLYRQENKEPISFSTWLNDTLLDGSIFPMLRNHYSIESEPRLAGSKLTAQLSLKDLFFVKYDADQESAQRSLELHMDSSLLSFIIPLSSPKADPESETKGAQADIGHLRSEDQKILTMSNATLDQAINEKSNGFKGGGTKFMHIDQPLTTPKGSLLLFPSRLYHEGLEVVEGIRYVIVGFVNVHMANPWNYFLYRFGRFSRCVCVTTHSGALSTWRHQWDINTQPDSCHCLWGIQIYAHDVLSSLQELLRVNTREPLSTQYLKRGIQVLIATCTLVIIYAAISIVWESAEYQKGKKS